MFWFAHKPVNVYQDDGHQLSSLEPWWLVAHNPVLQPMTTLSLFENNFAEVSQAT